MPFSLLVKPVGGDCNLRCTYCFYRGHPPGRMDAKLFARLLESFEALPFAGKSVILQGGANRKGSALALWSPNVESRSMAAPNAMGKLIFK